jgi:hypothetical protein
VENEERLKAEINTMTKQKDYPWILLAKHLSGECSEDEYNQFRKILMDNPDFEATANSLTNIWNTTNTKNGDGLQEFWDRHIQRMQVKGIRFQNERI